MPLQKFSCDVYRFFLKGRNQFVMVFWDITDSMYILLMVYLPVSCGAKGLLVKSYSTSLFPSVSPSEVVRVIQHSCVAPLSLLCIFMMFPCWPAVWAPQGIVMGDWIVLFNFTFGDPRWWQNWFETVTDTITADVELNVKGYFCQYIKHLLLLVYISINSCHHQSLQ